MARKDKKKKGTAKPPTFRPVDKKPTQAPTFKPVQKKSAGNAQPTFKPAPPHQMPQKTQAPEHPEAKKMPVTLQQDLDNPPKPIKAKGSVVPEDEMGMHLTTPKTAGGGSWQERFEGILNDVLSRMERLENTNNALSDEISELRENINELETNMHELTALYDAISAQYNPFIDLTPRERKLVSGGEVAPVEEEGAGTEENAEEFEVAEIEEVPSEEGEVLQTEGFEELGMGEALVEARPQRVERGYILPDIPDNSMSHMMAIKWTEFMLQKVGPKNIRKLLEYYRSLRWISEKVVNNVLHQVQGLNTENIEAEYDTWKMNTDDHMKTLVFIEKIKGSEVGTIHAEEVQDIANDITQG